MKVERIAEMQIFFYPLVLTYVLGAQKNRLIEYLQHMFWLRNKKINFSVHTLN